MKTGSENRRHTRYTVDEGIFAAFKSPESSQYSIVGRVVDISEQGLGVQHYAFQDEAVEYGEIKIFGMCSLESIPCKVVYHVDLEGRTIPGFLSVRRCGMELGEMSSAQRAQMDYLVRHHSAGVLPPHALPAGLGIGEMLS